MLFKKQVVLPSKENFVKCIKRYYALKALNLTSAMYYDKEHNSFFPFVPPVNKNKTLIMFPEYVTEDNYDDFIKLMSEEGGFEINIKFKKVNVAEINDINEDLEALNFKNYGEIEYQMAQMRAGIYPKNTSEKEKWDEKSALRRRIDNFFLPDIILSISDGKINKDKILYTILFDIGATIGSLVRPMDVIYHNDNIYDAILATGLAYYFETKYNKQNIKCVKTNDENIDISLISSRPDVFCVIFDGDDEIMNEDMCLWSMKKLIKYHKAGYVKNNINVEP